MSTDLLEQLVSLATANGADAADAVLIRGTSLGVQVRQGRTEELERSEHNDIGLRVFVGQRSAIVSATSADPASFHHLATQAIAMARVVPEDRFAGLCEHAASWSLDGAGAAGRSTAKASSPNRSCWSRTAS